MDCRILRHLTLKADGHLGCDDSIGYGTNLGHVSLSPGWRLRDVLNGPIYAHVRSAFKVGKVPWPGVCESCDLFSSGAQPVDTLDTRIELLVEPTLACNLSCACCVRKQIISKGRSTSSLDPAILGRLIDSCQSENIIVDQVHYIGWGEPLMHGDFRALFEIVKKGTPQAIQMVTSAGNVDFCSTVGDAELDRLIVSCDGASQESYGRYRRGGDFETVVKFMRDCRKHGSPAIFLEWKYILFEFNDSDDEIFRAQEIADDIGVDSLLFIITNSKWHSKRFTVENSSNVPIRSLVASVSPAAAMNAIAVECTSFDFPGGREKAFGFIDKCTLSVGKFLTIEGWVFDKDGNYAEHLELIIDGKVRAKARSHLRRIDVTSAHPGTAGAKCGFMFRVPVASNSLPKSIVVEVYGSTGLSILGGGTSWMASDSSIKRRLDLPFVQFDNEISREMNKNLVDHTGDKRIAKKLAAGIGLIAKSKIIRIARQR